MSENNRVQYNLAGLKNLTLTENFTFKIENSQYIEAIQLDDNLTKIKVYLKDGIHYDSNAEDIDFFIKQIIFNLITKTDAEIMCPDWYTEGVFENEKLKIVEHIKLQEDIVVFRSYSAKGIYDVVANSPTAICKHTVLYERIFGILQNENRVVQFMTLYQILLENTSILAGAKSEQDYSQSKVVCFLKKHAKEYPFISFQPSRDPRKKGKDEDTFTYMRNEIGHCEETNNLIEYKQAGKQITSDLIKKILIVLNDVLMLL